MTKMSLLLSAMIFSTGMLFATEIKSDEADDRRAGALSPSEKAYILNQMRLFVESIQTIAAGLGEGDLARAADAAAARGLKRNVKDPAFPSTLAAKLPDAWKQFGGGLRRGFDSLAQTIADERDTNRSLKQLSGLMTNCIGCHASYRVVDAAP